jgi:hypothetical protein
MPTYTCEKCARVYKQRSGFMDHQMRQPYCDLEDLTAMDLYMSAFSAYNTRVSNYVRAYYANIREAVNQGKFNITLTFDCDADMRKTLLTTVIEHLSKKFSGVVFTPAPDSDSFVADWSQQKTVESKTDKALRYIREFSKAASKDEVYEDGYPVTSLKDLDFSDFSNTQSLPEIYDDALDAGPTIKIIIFKDTSGVPETSYSYFT